MRERGLFSREHGERGSMAPMTDADAEDRVHLKKKCLTWRKEVTVKQDRTWGAVRHG
jgi:hypothetical protein